MSEHTPLPWTSGVFFTGDEDQRAIVSGPKGELIARSYFVGDEPEANIAFIVQAVNAHESLVAALAAYLDPDGHTPSCVWSVDGTCLPRCSATRAALALAREEQP